MQSHAELAYQVCMCVCVCGGGGGGNGRICPLPQNFRFDDRVSVNVWSLYMHVLDVETKHIAAPLKGTRSLQ